MLLPLAIALSPCNKAVAATEKSIIVVEQCLAEQRGFFFHLWRQENVDEVKEFVVDVEHVHDYWDGNAPKTVQDILDGLPELKKQNTVDWKPLFIK